MKVYVSSARLEGNRTLTICHIAGTLKELLEIFAKEVMDMNKDEFKVINRKDSCSFVVGGEAFVFSKTESFSLKETSKKWFEFVETILKTNDQFARGLDDFQIDVFNSTEPAKLLIHWR